MDFQLVMSQISQSESTIMGSTVAIVRIWDGLRKKLTAKTRLLLATSNEAREADVRDALDMLFRSIFHDGDASLALAQATRLKLHGLTPYVGRRARVVGGRRDAGSSASSVSAPSPSSTQCSIARSREESSYPGVLS